MSDIRDSERDQVAPTPNQNPSCRYFVFKYNTYYPEGGMNDCVMMTNDLELARRTAQGFLDDFYNTHVHDIVTNETVPLNLEDD